MFLATSNIGDVMADCETEINIERLQQLRCWLGLARNLLFYKVGILVCAPVDGRNRFLSKQNFAGQKCIGSN